MKTLFACEIVASVKSGHWRLGDASRLASEGLERFDAGGTAAWVHECVFAVWALESEPVDLLALIFTGPIENGHLCGSNVQVAFSGVYRSREEKTGL